MVDDGGVRMPARAGGVEDPMNQGGVRVRDREGPGLGAAIADQSRGAAP